MAKKTSAGVMLYQSGEVVKSPVVETAPEVILKPVIVALKQEAPCGKKVGSEPKNQKVFKTNYDKLVWSDFDELAEHMGRFLRMVFDDTSGQFDADMTTAELVEACFDWLDEEAVPSNI
jgi:hypothetical protein